MARIIRSLTVIVSIMATVGCGTGTQASDLAENPWAAEFARVAESTESDFIRGVLADGEVTEAEFAEARERFVDCMSEHGVPTSWDNSGGQWNFVLSGAAQPTPDADGGITVTSESPQGICMRDSIDDVQNFYVQTRLNPNNQDIDSLTAECMVRKEIVPEGFTKNDLDEWEMQFAINPDSGPPYELEGLPEGVVECWSDPLGLTTE